MNVGDKLNNLPLDTVIHIESLDHWNLIQKHTDLVKNYTKEVLNKDFCIKKTRDHFYTYSSLNFYMKKYNSNIISSSLLLDSIHECW